ncbi:MAG: hypothetical protein AB7G13_11570 [Lautropia sp.]
MSLINLLEQSGRQARYEQDDAAAERGRRALMACADTDFIDDVPPELLTDAVVSALALRDRGDAAVGQRLRREMERLLEHERDEAIRRHEP